MSSEHPVDPSAAASGPPGAVDPSAPSTSSSSAPLPKPTLRERLRPWELLGLSAVVAVVVGVVVLLSTRGPQIAFVFGGIAFIVSLVMFAMLSLTSTPTGAERHDLDEQDRGH